MDGKNAQPYPFSDPELKFLQNKAKEIFIEYQDLSLPI